MAERTSSYRDLLVWRNALDLAQLSYETTRSFPREELYGMTTQIRRCSVSIAANIAEGYGRNSARSFAQFLKIAQGSLKELETHLILANRLGFVGAAALEKILAACDELGRMLLALIRTVQRKAGD